MHAALRVVVPAALLLAGCAGYSPTVGVEERPTAKDAYLYGRFQMVKTTQNVFTGNPQAMGFTFKCADENVYTVRFEPTAAVQVVKITPSTCSLQEFVYTSHTGEVSTRKPVPDGLKRAVAYEAGKAYYLGDYQAESTQTTNLLVINRTWRLRSARNNYARTTESFRAAYPNLSTLPTEDRMIGSKVPAGTEF